MTRRDVMAVACFTVLAGVCAGTGSPWWVVALQLFVADAWLIWALDDTERRERREREW